VAGTLAAKDDASDVVGVAPGAPLVGVKVLGCEHSPSRAGTGTDNGIVTTAATNKKDSEMAISNYGRCVDLWAPGVGTLSTRMGGGTTRMSGTSMASPHAGGGAALYLRSHTSASPSEVERTLKAAARQPGTKSKDGQAILLENVGSF